MTRLSTLQPAEATGKAKRLLDGVQKKLGMTPNMMRVMANAPAALDAYLQFSGSLGGGQLPASVREQIALTVGQANSCDYCVAAHSAIGKSVGLNQDHVRDARLGTSPDAKTDAILRFASQIVRQRGFVSEEEIDRVREAGLSDGEIVEVVANTALNLFTNYFNHVAQTDVDFPPPESLESATAGATHD